jgi:phosphohistidine phosphatase
MDASAARRLYIVRHADAEPGIDDTIRPLSRKGRRQSKTIGSFLRRAGVSVDAIWQSDLLRAQQTAEIVAKAIQRPDTPVTVKGLGPDDSVRTLLRRINAFRGNLMVVGHAPSLPCLVPLILRLPQQHQVINLKKGSVVCFETDASGRWSLQWCIEPGICG